MTPKERENSEEGRRLLLDMLGHLLRENFFDDLGDAELGAFFAPWYGGLLAEKARGGELPAWPQLDGGLGRAARSWFPRLWDAAVQICGDKLLAEDVAAGKLAKISEVGRGGKVVNTWFRPLQKEEDA
jgi:hypothetical protein